MPIVAPSTTSTVPITDLYAHVLPSVPNCPESVTEFNYAEVR